MASLNTDSPDVFLSYAWANETISSEIDRCFIEKNIYLLRDVRDVKYTESIKSFMHRIGKSDYIIMLITDEYIKSENCMYEMGELLNTHEFEERILPIILKGTSIYTIEEQGNYYDYWQNRLEKVNGVLLKHTNSKTVDDKRKIQNIYDNLGLFFQKISELKAESFENLKNLNYKPLFDKIGYIESTGSIQRKSFLPQMLPGQRLSASHLLRIQHSIGLAESLLEIESTDFTFFKKGQSVTAESLNVMIISIDKIRFKLDEQMNWKYFPVRNGQQLTALILNEMVNAVNGILLKLEKHH